MSICGTESHMAPEVQLDEGYNKAADMFSFGVFLVEMMARHRIGSLVSLIGSICDGKIYLIQLTCCVLTIRMHQSCFSHDTQQNSMKWIWATLGLLASKHR